MYDLVLRVRRLEACKSFFYIFYAYLKYGLQALAALISDTVLLVLDISGDIARLRFEGLRKFISRCIAEPLNTETKKQTRNALNLNSKALHPTS